MFLATSIILGGALVGSWLYIYRHLMSSNSPPRLAAVLGSPVSPLQVLHRLDVPGRGEIFPAFASHSPADYWPVAMLTISNTSDHPVLEVVSAEIPDWSKQFTKTVIVGPHEARVVRIEPELLLQAYENTEIRQTALEVHAAIWGNLSEFTQTQPVFLHPVSDLYWGKEFANAQFVARWVTPHDPAVIDLVSTAREYVPRGRLAGYNLPGGNSPDLVAAQVQREAKAVFEAMAHKGVSYVDSIYTLGNFTTTTERVRLPRETLSQDSANCIDVSVAFASAMENLGMDPVIVIVPGHAFTGVRLGPGSKHTLYLDLTVLPDGSFPAAVARAQHWLKKTPPNWVVMVDVAAARALGIYPMPEPATVKS